MHLGMIFFCFDAGYDMMSLPAKEICGQERQNEMKTIIHDLGNEYNAYLASRLSVKKEVNSCGIPARCAGCFETLHMWVTF